nr:hypothetical protein [Afipia sp. GAS231]
MTHAWYVTFEVLKSGVLPRKRSPRETRVFETEAEAKNFARAKFEEGLKVYAGTINPHSPRKLIVSTCIACWLEDEQEQEAKSSNDAGETRRK